MPGPSLTRSSSFIVQSPEELLALCGPAELFRRPNMIFQEYIPGEDLIFHGYRNAETDCFVGLAAILSALWPDRITDRRNGKLQESSECNQDQDFRTHQFLIFVRQS